ncbi:hypothetical protein Agabi119p4_9313 [Agaricus bisporus var. burnettii]|uniref:Uncharacterized protein n=1 Tax=Agaricus bisporus var. burnettii TaxID=192524 RepID=A0A8H7C5L2_AGABI|nr:hypothetical protein Agabi119p4_9290 [Agaricus bisporus var. burnettii]KAF7762720.1 hypothetical protein Agabi119p4_9313 [Agaricus bisporus var. burnettii]
MDMGKTAKALSDVQGKFIFHIIVDDEASSKGWTREFLTELLQLVQLRSKAILCWPLYDAKSGSKNGSRSSQSKGSGLMDTGKIAKVLSDVQDNSFFTL